MPFDFFPPPMRYPRYPSAATTRGQRVTQAANAASGPYGRTSFGESGGGANAANPYSWEVDNFRAQTLGNIAGESGRADTAEGAYLNYALSFDPQQALNRYAQGAWGSISQALGQQLRDLAGRSVGAGRLDTGFYDEDQGQIMRNALADFSNSLAQQSLNATQLGLQNAQGLSQFGQASRDRALDLLASAYSARNEEDAAKRARRNSSGLGGLIGGIVGSAIPGIGNALGSYLGSRLFGG